MSALSTDEQAFLDAIEEGWRADAETEEGAAALDRAIDQLHRAAGTMRREVFVEALRRIGAL